MKRIRRLLFKPANAICIEELCIANDQRFDLSLRPIIQWPVKELL